MKRNLGSLKQKLIFRKFVKGNVFESLRLLDGFRIYIINNDQWKIQITYRNCTIESILDIFQINKSDLKRAVSIKITDNCEKKILIEISYKGLLQFTDYKYLIGTEGIFSRYEIPNKNQSDLPKLIKVYEINKSRI